VSPIGPETGLAEINSDLLEADFELGTRRFAVIQEKGGRQLAFQMKIVSRRGVQTLGSLLDELVCHPPVIRYKDKYHAPGEIWTNCHAILCFQSR
jgi:hypothetical protein